MITVEEAISAVRVCTDVLDLIDIKLSNSLGSVIAKDILSPVNIPCFANSAMDGYAVALSTNPLDNKKFRVMGEVKAGDSVNEYVVKENEAVRIFTGAPVPPGANCVIKQEDVTFHENVIEVSTKPAPGDNIRPVGEEVKEGELALKSGMVMNPASVGFASNMGLTSIEVVRQPNIAVIVTGSELTQPGIPLENGKIYESNSSTIASALQSKGFNNYNIELISDSLEETKEAVVKNLATKDILILTGGISVGDYDFTGKALRDLGVKEVFYKVNQKPGKPLFFGTLGKKLVFVLPGNPAAALTNFYIYILPALRKMSGNINPDLEASHLHLTSSYHKKRNVAHFLKAQTIKDEVHILEGQSSYMLRSYICANALVYIPVGIYQVNKGDKVITYLI